MTFVGQCECLRNGRLVKTLSAALGLGLLTRAVEEPFKEVTLFEVTPPPARLF